MPRIWRRVLIALGLVGVALYLVRRYWSEAVAEVGLWPAALVFGGLVIVIAGSIAFDFWLGRGLIRWVRGHRD